MLPLRLLVAAAMTSDRKNHTEQTQLNLTTKLHSADYAKLLKHNDVRLQVQQLTVT